jgi:hypothetical protein
MFLSAIFLQDIFCWGGEAGEWQQLAKGLEFAQFKVAQFSPVGDSTIYIVRINPNFWEFQLWCASEMNDKKNRTAKEWCREFGLTSAINAGMFDTDFSTHIGYAKNYSHINNPMLNASYHSLAVFAPKEDLTPEFRIYDLDEVDDDSIITNYNIALQNLRLIKRPGLNRWQPQDKMWSEAALGEDDAGNALFIYCRSPYSMHDFNNLLLNLPIKVVCAQHLEGGPEAQLYLNLGDAEIALQGIYETNFFEDGVSYFNYQIPNVIGIKKRVK